MTPFSMYKHYFPSNVKICKQLFLLDLPSLALSYSDIEDDLGDICEEECEDDLGDMSYLDDGVISNINNLTITPDLETVCKQNYEWFHNGWYDSCEKQNRLALTELKRRVYEQI